MNRHRPSRRANSPLPVLLCKLSALRVMSGSERAASGPRQGRKKYTEVLGNGKSTQNFAFSKFLVHAKKLLKKQLFMHGVWLSFSASQHIHFRNFIDQWHHLNVFDSQKIRVVEMNAQISRKSTLTTEKLPTP